MSNTKFYVTLFTITVASLIILSSLIGTEDEDYYTDKGFRLCEEVIKSEKNGVNTVIAHCVAKYADIKMEIGRTGY